MADLADMPDIEPGYFSTRYNLKGKGWICSLSNEDRAAFIHYGLAKMQYGRLGGQARAKSANRDSRGRFIQTKEG